MLTFLANARDGSAAASAACGSCCCRPVQMRPGETNKWVINWQPWVAPIGGRGLCCLPVYTVENITPVVATTAANRPATNIDYAVVTSVDVAVTGTVATSGVDPEGQPLTFKLLPLYAPRFGTLVFNADGTYTYTPSSQYVGYDEFYFSTSDSVNRAAINKVMITVNALAPIPALPVKAPTPLIWIDPMRISVKNPIVEFPVSVSPAARPGDLYKLTMIQTAMDCDGTAFTNEICFDMTIGGC